MRSCIHVGFVGGNGNRHRRTRSAEKRHPDKTPKRISWNLNARGEVPNNSACTAQSSPREITAPIKNGHERQLPQTPRIPPQNTFAVEPSSHLVEYDLRHLSPRQQQQYSYSTPTSPFHSRKLPTPPTFQHTCMSPEFRC